MNVVYFNICPLIAMCEKPQFVKEQFHLLQALIAINPPFFLTKILPQIKQEAV